MIWGDVEDMLPSRFTKSVFYMCGQDFIKSWDSVTPYTAMKLANFPLIKTFW